MKANKENIKEKNGSNGGSVGLRGFPGGMLRVLHRLCRMPCRGKSEAKAAQENDGRIGKEKAMDQIETTDRGVIWGDTWHRKAQYIRQDFPVTVQQAMEVMDYPMEIRASYGVDAFGERYPTGANHVFRTDTDTVIAPAVGNQFMLIDQSEFVFWTQRRLLDHYPDLQIESVGTLYGGQTSFISVVLGRHRVKGDESETLQRMLFSNPIGTGSYSTGLNEVRVVCDNTRRLAIGQSQRNESIRYVQHTASARAELEKNMIDLAEVRLALDVERQKMDYLAGTGVTVAEVDAFLEGLFPTKDNQNNEKEGRGLTMAIRKQEAVAGIFESKQYGFLQGYDRSAYALFNALSNYLEREKGRGGADVSWDNVTGRRASLKDKALALLVK
jgi:phage/plasmid-like protein (TIGR03299 family)